MRTFIKIEMKCDKCNFYDGILHFDYLFITAVSLFRRNQIFKKYVLSNQKIETQVTILIELETELFYTISGSKLKIQNLFKQTLLLHHFTNYFVPISQHNKIITN